MLKEKNKPSAPARAKGMRARKRRPGEAEEAADPELPASALEACSGLLRSILTHWAPEFPSADPEREDPDLHHFSHNLVLVFLALSRLHYIFKCSYMK